jgi:nitrogen-specific signal transduction histidine kinase
MVDGSYGRAGFSRRDRALERIYRLNSGIEILIDRERLGRATLKIINNAIHALRDDESEGNELTVETRIEGDRLEI